MDKEFYYCELSDEIKRRITGISFPSNQESIRISYDDLRYVHVLYVGFDGKHHEGELIVNAKIACDTVSVFKELFDAGYEIEKIRLIDEYGADDELSMADNNSSAFNYRVIANTDILSNHALGLAIDINPMYNPYITFIDGKMNVAPDNSKLYVNRDIEFPHKITSEDLCCVVFKKYGFEWGGDWEGKKDYQHFDKNN